MTPSMNSVGVPRTAPEHRLAAAVSVEPPEVEPELDGVPPQVVVRQRVLAVKEQLVHLPEPVLQRRSLGGGRGGERVRMDLGQRDVTEREPDPIAESSLDLLDLAFSVARVRALVVPVLEDQASGHATADVIDRVVDRL
jgi:hypothetical protein